MASVCSWTRGRLSAVAADRPPVQGSRPRPRKKSKPQAARIRPLRAGLQDRQREARRPGVPAHLLRRTAPGRHDHRTPSNKQVASASATFIGCSATAATVWKWPGPGEIVAVVGLKQTDTGHTLCSQEQPIAAGRDSLPRAGHLAGDHPGKNVDETKLADALGKMVRDDPTLQVPHRSGDEPAHPQRHGRVAPGSGGPQAEARSRRQGDASAGRWWPIGKRWPRRSSSRRATSSSRAAAASSPSST